jgi:hypothetical protein
MDPKAVIDYLARTTPRQRLLAVELLILLLGIVLLLEFSPATKASRNARASEHFGEALLRMGIETQASPSK